MTDFSKSDKDIELADPPTDSISALSFSPAANFLAVGSWANDVRIYEINPSDGKSQGKAAYNHEGAVLSVCWSKDGTKVISGGTDNAGRMLDVQTGQSSQVAQHDAPVRCVRWTDTPQGGILITGGWDKMLKYWDLRSPNAIATVQLKERCYAMDVTYPLLVVGTAERHMQVFNLTNPSVPYRDMISPLKWQTRVVKTFTTADGFAIGSIEGRVSMQYVEDNRASSNYSFRCHRRDQAPNVKDTSLVYSVNDIDFHPQATSAFSTAGSDGVVSFWDRDARVRLKTFDPAPAPISCSCFNPQGTLFAYAVSYDWHKGHTGYVPNQPNKVMIHSVKEDDIKKKNTTATRR